MTTTEQCETCGGKGTVQISMAQGTAPAEPVSKACPVCGGSGAAPRPGSMGAVFRRLFMATDAVSAAKSPESYDSSAAALAKTARDCAGLLRKLPAEAGMAERSAAAGDLEALATSADVARAAMHDHALPANRVREAMDRVTMAVATAGLSFKVARDATEAPLPEGPRADAS